MRENLLGYLLNAIEPDERSAVEQQLPRDTQLQTELNVLRTGLRPLVDDQTHHAPPAGLAKRCCDYVYSCTAIMPAKLSSAESAGMGPSRRWSWLDLTVAGAIAVAVSVLLLPAIYQSHVQSQMLACQNNLKDLGLAMAKYSTLHGGYYPAMPRGDRLNESGIWSPTLVGDKYLTAADEVVCPSSEQAEDRHFSVPTVQQLNDMKDTELAQALPHLSSYGTTLGHVGEGTYKTQQHRSRKNFAVMADMPGDKGTNSPNHGALGQNVLFDDGHVRRLTSPQATPDDNIFTNANGEIAHGVHSEDAVIVQPQLRAE